MARQGQRQILGRDTTAIVSHTDHRLAAVGIFHGDTPRARVDGVLDQFLHRRGRTFYRLARSDAVDRGIVQLADDGAVFAYIGGRDWHTARPSMGHSDSARSDCVYQRGKTESADRRQDWGDPLLGRLLGALVLLLFRSYQSGGRPGYKSSLAELATCIDAGRITGQSKIESVAQKTNRCDSIKRRGRRRLFADAAP